MDVDLATHRIHLNDFGDPDFSSSSPLRLPFFLLSETAAIKNVLSTYWIDGYACLYYGSAVDFLLSYEIQSYIRRIVFRDIKDAIYVLKDAKI